MKLPDPPEQLESAPRQLYGDVRSLLEQIRPRRLDWDNVSARFDRSEFQLVLPHADEPDWQISIYVSPRRVTVSLAGAHEDFESGDPRWWLNARTFVNDIMRGRIEVVTKTRGDDVISVRHRRRDDSGGAAGYGQMAQQRTSAMSWGQPDERVVRMDFGCEG